MCREERSGRGPAAGITPDEQDTALRCFLIVLWEVE